MVVKQFDQVVMDALAASRTPALDAVVARVTRFGDHGLGWIAVATVGSLVDRPRKREWKRARRAVVRAYGVNQLVKLAVPRKRPQTVSVAHAVNANWNRSFPSAHATTSFAAARTLAPLMPAPIVYGAAAVVAGTRPYLRLHFPTDSIVGAGLGMLIGRRAACKTAARIDAARQRELEAERRPTVGQRVGRMFNSLDEAVR